MLMVELAVCVVRASDMAESESEAEPGIRQTMKRN